MTDASIIAIRLPAGIQADLDWSQEDVLAQAAISRGQSILWDLDLELSNLVFKPNDKAAFNAVVIALEEFNKRYIKIYREHSFGLILYRGTLDFERHFPKGFWEAEYAWYLEENPSGSERLFAANLLGEYLHRLLSFLPDELRAWICVDTSFASSLAEAAQILSSERFEHLTVTGPEGPYVERPTSSATTGICLPADVACSPPVMQKLEELLVQLQGRCQPLRIIPEAKLNEQWDGIDDLYVIEEALSVQGKRKLQGFMAAGGNVIY